MKKQSGFMALKNEQSVKKYLQNLSDSEIDAWYESIEYTPFPILLAKEYYRRHKSTSELVLDEIKTKANKVKRKTNRLKHDTAETGKKLGQKLQNNTSKGIKKSVNSIKDVMSTDDNIELLEKLGELKRAQVITQKEFHEKKKKLLARI